MIEKGSTLSSGERQLISFARALAFDPAILILDEATAHIDTETEAVIQKALDVVKQGRTTFVIAHRLSTIRNADQILVLDKGEIVERGNHEELMEVKGQYYQMYECKGSKAFHCITLKTQNNRVLGFYMYLISQSGTVSDILSCNELTIEKISSITDRNA